LLLFDTQANKFEHDSPAGYKKRSPLQLPLKGEGREKKKGKFLEYELPQIEK